jgi:ornithine carbamoyltransferase
MPAARRTRRAARRSGGRKSARPRTTTVRARRGRVTFPPHLLSIRDLEPPALARLLAEARALKRARGRRGTARPLAHRTLAMVFQKPSLRTRVSFEAGMTDLGGHAIYLGPDDIRLGARETVEDVALVLSRMCHGIMARVFGHDIVEELARHATVPVINGLSAREHPCQALGDMLTMLERKGRLAGLKVAFVGDGNNVAHSLLYSAARAGFHLTVVGPPGYEPDAALVADAAGLAGATGGGVAVTYDLDQACRGVDVVYTDVWASMGQEAEAEERKRVFGPYRIDERVMGLAAPDAILMHCLPAHYGQEIQYDVSRGPHSALFDQAENRLHAQKAVLVRLMR